MLLRIVVILSTLFAAFMILFVSVLRTASIRNAFYRPASTASTNGHLPGEVVINYDMPFPGSILPNHPLWPLKVARDKFWLFITRNSGRKAELNLLFADKRLVSSKILFERNKPDVAFSTLLKAREYFKESSKIERENRALGDDTTEFLIRLANASLKHRQVIDEISLIAPEDAKPKVDEVQVYTVDTYEEVSSILKSMGEDAPVNPYN